MSTNSTIDLTASETRVFEIRTAAGTELLLEVNLPGDGGLLTRKPGMHRPDGHTEAARLPGDFEPLPLTSLPELRIGEPAVFALLIDGSPQARQSAPLLSVSEVA
jgi:hypothetical protein